MNLIMQIILLVWFFGCIVSYKTKKKTLVDGVGIKSAEFFMLCLYSAGIVTYYVIYDIGRWILLGVLVSWFVVQFFCHWCFTIFGASEKKLEGYNKCFRNSVRIIPASETRLIPDLYHIVLHMIILTNIVLIIIFL
ncbi:MAG TPA: hypothetical protein VJY54_02170 [Lachnospiraceae bacterium]|nr:hypothetical protein [Lachnospiraceae bacterium]